MTEGASQLSAQAQAREDPHDSQRHSVGHRPTWSASALFQRTKGPGHVRCSRAGPGSSLRAAERTEQSSVVGAASKDSRATTGAEEDKSHSAACASGDWRAPMTSVRAPRRKCRARWPGPPETAVFWRHRFHVKENRKSPFKSIQFHSNRFSSRAL